MSGLQQARVSALIFLLSAGTGLFPNVVLCVGDNGHRALELVSEGCCHPQAPEGYACTEPSDHCSSKCKDVRLTADLAISKSAEHDLLPGGIARIPVMALIPVPWMQGSWTGAIALRVQMALCDFPVLREHHTTVQLC